MVQLPNLVAAGGQVLESFAMDRHRALGSDIYPPALSSGDGTDDEKGFGTRDDGGGQFDFLRLGREILGTREEADKGPTLSADVIADGAL